jgi:hypothetical protein
MEEKYLPLRKHLNSKRVYPFWKVCQICQKPFQTFTKEAALRKQTCSEECRWILFTKNATGTHTGLKVKRIIKNCLHCGKEITIREKQLKYNIGNYCSRSCRAKAHAIHLIPYCKNGLGKKRPGKGLKLEKNPAWKGGVTYFKTHGNYKGVKYMRCPAEYLVMARKDGYVMEHRLIVAQHLNRPLLRTEVIHHINHDPTDNRLQNLMLFKTNQEHKLHEGIELKLKKSNTPGKSGV